jgi:hypothetical protein
LPGPETGGAAPVVQRPPGSGNEAIQRKQVGPGFGSPIPPVAEIRAWFAEPGPVQREGADASTSPEPGEVQAIASSGLAGAGAALPHGATIQRAFGGHDLSDVRAHVGGAATTASASLGAEAYATGNHVAFASAPDLHTAAHEAAHVVQQRAGAVSFEGVNPPGDHHEQQADRVADAVVGGRSAESLLDGIPGAGDRTTASRSIQRRPDKMSGSTDTAPLAADSDPVWAFEPTALSFNGAGEADVVIRNVSRDPQTIGDWDVAGDDQAFVVGLLQGVSVAPGDAISVHVRFSPSGGMPQAATLTLHSPGHEADGGGTARLSMGGIRRSDRQVESHEDGEVCGVEIASTTSSGNLNSIQGALGSVHAAWGAVFAQQRAGVDIIHRMAGHALPKETSGWQRVLDDVIAEGLVLAVGAVGLHLGAGLALAAWNALEKMRLKDDAAAAAKDIAGLTLKVHHLLVNDVTRSIGAQVSAEVRQAINESPKDAGVSVVMREAFFLGQNKALAGSYADAVTSINNREGDFSAMETRHAGLGFAALEAYRNHLHCETAAIGAIQSRTTLGMWASFLARMELGTHDGEPQGARPGADLEANILGPQHASDGQWREKLGKGVLELHVVWDKLHIATNPVLRIKQARVSGLHPEMKAMMTTAPLREFPIPIIAHGNLYSQLGNVDSELGVGRNEGGAVWFRARADEESGRVLGLLGGGDASEGSRVILNRIDDITLSEVE